MNRPTWLAALFATFIFPALAQNAPLADTDTAQVQPGQTSLVTLHTRYGQVQYYPRGGTIIASGYSWDTLHDVTRDWGVFQLSGKDVIFFENYHPGFSPGECFFVVLKPGKDAEFIRVPIDPVGQPIKKVWQDGEVIYVETGGGMVYEGITSPVKFDFSKTPFGPRLPDS